MDPTERTTMDTPCDNPSEYNLPKTISITTPPETDLPDDVNPDTIPDEITIHDYSDHPGENTDSALTDMFGDTLRNRALVIFLRHRNRDLHPDELAARAGIPDDQVPAVISALRTTNLIRRTRVEAGIPFYELNQLNETARNLYGLERAGADVTPPTPSAA